MSTVIICILLALIIIFAVVNSAKHFRGEGGCCGGGSDIKVKKKKLANVKETLVISIDGMTCKNCSMSLRLFCLLSDSSLCCSKTSDWYTEW